MLNLDDLRRIQKERFEAMCERARSVCDLVSELHRFAARRARREAQWYRWPDLRMLLRLSTLAIPGGGSYAYRDKRIGWLRRERRRWQSKQR